MREQRGPISLGEAPGETGPLAGMRRNLAGGTALSGPSLQSRSADATGETIRALSKGAGACTHLRHRGPRPHPSVDTAAAIHPDPARPGETHRSPSNEIASAMLRRAHRPSKLRNSKIRDKCS